MNNFSDNRSERIPLPKSYLLGELSAGSVLPAPPSSGANLRYRTSVMTPDLAPSIAPMPAMMIITELNTIMNHGVRSCSIMTILEDS